jgi:hypothetical protein
MLALPLALLTGAVAVAGPQGELDAVPEDTLSAEEIYARVLQNRFEASVQDMRLVSADPGGDAQQIQVYAWFRHYPEGKPQRDEENLLAKSLVRYLRPRDYRGIGYLILRRTKGAHDQFVYAPSRRKVRRFNMREEDIAGTDFALEDLLPRELEDADYRREDDAAIDGEPCYVVEATLNPKAQSQYSRFLLYVEKQHYVPLRTRYWDTQGVEVKELLAPLESIEQVGEVWLARERTARNLLERTETRLRIERIEVDAELSERVFSQRWLGSKRPPPVPWGKSDARSD